MCLIGFPGHLFCTIILLIGSRSLAFVEEILLSLDWFLVRETYVKLVQILCSPYVLVFQSVDGDSTVCHCIYHVSPRLLFLLTLVDLCLTQTDTRSNWLNVPWHLYIWIFIIPLVTKLFLFLLSFVPFYFLDICGLLMGLFSSRRHLGLGNATSCFSNISQSWPNPHFQSDLF